MQPRGHIFWVLLSTMLVLVASGCNDSPVTPSGDTVALTGAPSPATSSVNCKRDKALDRPAQIQSVTLESPMRIHLLSVAGSDASSSNVRINWYEIRDAAGVVTYVPSGIYYGDTKDLLDIRVQGLQPAGRYTIKLYSSDVCGNGGYSATWSTVMPALAPETTRPVVSAPIVTNYGTTLPVRVVAVRAADNTGISKIEFYFNGVLKNTMSLQNYIHWWLGSESPVYRWTIPSDLKGKYGLVTVRVVDPLDNVTEASANLTL